MSSTFQPPINISPEQDNVQQVSFINQNFQSLAAALESNSFRIVQEGIISGSGIFNTSNPGAGNFVSDGFTIATYSHTLGYIPGAIVYYYDGVNYYPLPSLSFSGVSGPAALWANVYCQINESTLKILLGTMRFGSGAASVNMNNTRFKYYLFQTTAN